MTNKKIDIELIRAKLADAVIIGQRWTDIALVFPEANESLYNEISKEISSKLINSSSQSRPKELYKGIGVEIDLCEQGLSVNEVYRDCPATKLGIKDGDIITKVNFESVSNIDLSNSLSKLRNSNYKEGMILEVIRNGETITLGYGLNIQTRVIDAKKKYPMNFTALAIGKRLMMSMGASMQIDSHSKLPQKKKILELAK
jgi:C-terminal processing protease CtpA/Prc